MKSLFLALTAALLMAVAPNQLSAQTADNDLATIEIKTSAICGMCKDALEKEMAYTKGVKSSTLDVKSKILTVTYKPEKTNPDNIRTAISKLGYDADAVMAVQKAHDKLPGCCQKGGVCPENE